MAIDGLSDARLSALAKDILSKDNDKIITKQELSNYLKTNESQFEDVTLQVIESQLINFLKENYAGDDESGASSDAANSSGGQSPVEQYNALKAQISENEALLKKYETEKSALTKQQSSLADSLKSEQKKYNSLEKEVRNENDEYKKIIDKINEATKNLEEEVAAQQKSAAYSAMNDYDPEKDGSWSEYIKKYMNNLNISPGFSAVLSDLISEADFKQYNLNALGAKLSTQANIVSNLSAQYKAVTNNLSSVQNSINAANEKINAAKQQLASNILSFISEEEYALVTKNNLDLTEKLSDGSPRYIFAKGKQDEKYHIYDMKAQNGASLARQFGGGSGLKGADICPSGNGYISGFKKLDANSSEGSDYFYFDSCDKVESGKACYNTCSPLSLDLEGDGVNTSDELINYDIDGDGKADVINNSADAVLVFDKDHDGISGENGSEAFGNNTDLDGDGKADGFKDGFEALKALAKQENLIGENDNELDIDDLKVLEEKWGLKVKLNGYNSEATSLSDSGITSIKLSQDSTTNLQDNFDGNGNQLMTQEGATFTVNGEEREYADIWHKKQNGGSSSSSSEQSGNMFSNDLSFDSALNLDIVNSKIKNSQSLAKKAKENARQAVKNAKNNNIFLNFISKSQSDDEIKKKKKEEDE